MTDARTEAAAKTAKTVALGLIEEGFSRDDAIGLGSTFAVFMDRNGDIAKGMLDKGEDPKRVLKELLASFGRFRDNKAEFLAAKAG